MKPTRLLSAISVNPLPPIVRGRPPDLLSPKKLAEPLGKIPAIAPGPALFRFEQPEEQKLLVAMGYASRVINGSLDSPHRLLGRIDYQVAGDRVEIRVPYFSPDAFVPKDHEVLALSAFLTGLVQQQDPSAQVALKLHRVRQPQLDAKILAQLVGRNIEREGKPDKVLRSLNELIETVRPDAPLNTTATGGGLPAYIVGWHAFVKGPADPKSLIAAKWKAAGGTIRRGDASRGIVADSGRHVIVQRPRGPFTTRITLFVKRWRDTTEWRPIEETKNRHIGND